MYAAGISTAAVSCVLNFDGHLSQNVPSCGSSFNLLLAPVFLELQKLKILSSNLSVFYLR